ncbi:MAG: tetratricopeptide repeat protein [Bacillaceae bacterium]|nr:tetratricopeptide repeat protein [Bacillaceae bacterium]
MGDYDSASQNFKKVLELNPTDLSAMYQLGITYAQLEEVNQAIPLFNKVIEMEQGHADAYYNLGVAYAVKGEIDLAFEKLDKAIDIQPGHPLAENAKKQLERIISTQ